MKHNVLTVLSVAALIIVFMLLSVIVIDKLSGIEIAEQEEPTDMKSYSTAQAQLTLF